MIIPTSGRLVLQKIKEDEKPKGSLILPTDHHKQDRYEIVAMDAFHNKIGVGRVVYIDKYKGVEILHEGFTLLVVSLDDVIAYEAE